MDNVCIFVEGKSDVKFLKDYLNHTFGIIPDTVLFDTLGGWAGYKAGGILKTEIQQRFDDGLQIILVLDADQDYNSRRQTVLTDFEEFNIPINLFLFPDDQHAGNLETLLAEIAANRDVMNCFLAYEECMGNYPKPLNDSRIYAYLDVLLFPNYKDENGKDLRTEGRNYQNPLHWNLNHEKLGPLKEFFQQFD